nr:something about silencing protein 10 [Quercus suber]
MGIGLLAACGPVPSVLVERLQPQTQILIASKFWKTIGNDFCRLSHHLTMAKRKTRSAHRAEDTGPDLDVGQTRKRIRTYEDVADSDDDFHKDRLMLEEDPEIKRQRQVAEEEEFLEASDEEVLGYSESDEQENEEEIMTSGRGASERSGSEDGEVDDEFQWGTTRDDLYGADDIETEEQALEEEAEALRLQKKQLQSMAAADYGFDESEWQDANMRNGSAADNATVVTEVLPQLQVTDDMGPAERLKLLKSRYPEFDPLSKELLHLQDRLGYLSREASIAKPRTDLGHIPIALTRYRAASAYAGTLTMYFSLLSSTAWNGASDVTAMSASQLRDHPVMTALVQCRDLWQRVKDLPLDEESDQIEETHLHGDVQLSNIVDDSNTLKAIDVLNNTQLSGIRPRSQAEVAHAANEARKAERMKRAEADLADLDNLIATSATHRSLKSSTQALAAAANDDSDVGEEAPLTAHEAAEKARRKKSLRFYTSQIVQKSNKRGQSGRHAGGDEDIPHRERLRDRQARLNAEAEKRGKKPLTQDVELGGDSDEEDDQQAKQLRAATGEEDYYDLVASRTNKKKSEKAALAEAQKQAALQGGQVIPQEVVGTDGKRKITYLIEKNKGLTPHRKKDVRNPRVKKRKKYDEKKKKLASMKPVYKGGEGRGGYGGELTGIKKGLVKSTKLS